MSDLQNSLFVPDLGRWVDRTRYLRLTKPDALPDSEATTDNAARPTSPAPTMRSRAASLIPDVLRPKSPLPPPPARRPSQETLAPDELPGSEVDRVPIAGRGNYAVVTEGLVDWENWTDIEKAELDDYVRHILHSKKWKAKRTWRGFKQYVSTREC